jgi:WD40 repeat protein
MRILDGGKGRINSLALSRDGGQLAVLRHGVGLEVWGLARDQVLRLHPPRAPAARVWFGADGRLYEDAIHAGQLVHNVKPGSAGHQLFGKRGHRPFALTGDGIEMVLVDSGRSPKLRRFALRDGKLDPVWEARLPRLSPLRVAVSADGGTVAFTYIPAGRHGTVAVAVHSGRTGEHRHTITKIRGEPLRVWVNRDGSRVATLNVKQVVVWDPATGEEVHKFSPEDPKPVWDWADEPTGTRLATAGRTFVRLWDTATWKETAAFDWKIGPVTAVALGPDSTLAAAGSDTGVIVVWDFDT